MENIINIIKEASEKIQALMVQVDKINSDLWNEKQKIKKLFVTKPGWNLFLSKYIVEGDIDEYVCSIDYYIDHGLDTPKGKNLNITINADNVIIVDYDYNEYDDWTFKVPLNTFIEFCSSEAYMQEVLDKLVSARKVKEQKEIEETEKRERELYEQLKKKYEHC